MKCPNCGGHLVVIGSRAWCVQRFDAGGCGTNWSHWSMGRSGGATGEVGFRFLKTPVTHPDAPKESHA